MKQTNTNTKITFLFLSEVNVYKYEKVIKLHTFCLFLLNNLLLERIESFLMEGVTLSKKIERIYKTLNLNIENEKLY